MRRRHATTLILAATAAVAASERAEPTAHFILLATQRTGSTAFAQLANWLQGGGSKCPSPLDTSREVDGPGARAVLKIHSKRLNETVLNWNVVVKTLTGTEFERFLHDDA